MTRRWVRLVLPAVLTTALSFPATAVAAPVWRVVDLGAGDNSVATAVNDLGHVVGERDGRAFLWRHGTFTDLGPGGAMDVNNRDEVVGWYFGGAFRWRDGVRTELGAFSQAAAINDRGEVVGTSLAGHALHWRAGVTTDLGSAYPYGSAAYDINDRGQVVGVVQEGPNYEEAPVRWWHGGLTRLHEPRGQSVAVSDSGVVTGIHWGSWGTAGFVWRRGEFVAIPVPPPTPSGFTFLQPYGVNDRAQVVGSSSEGAFLWQNGRTTVLPNLVSMSAAYDINDRGQVVGSSSVQQDGLNQHAVLWTRR